jgi:arylsulfatase A-like enzyme
VSLVDLPPTLLDGAGLPVPENMVGRSICPLVRGVKVDWPEEVFVQISEAQVGRAVRTGRWKYSVTAPDKHGGQDSGSDRYVEEFLYDLQADPHELRNLAGCESHRAVADRMRRRLLDRMEAVGEARPEIELAPATGGGQKRVSEAEIEA